MTVADLQALFDYGSWANHKLFDALGQLRGQVALLIRALGYAPGNIDLLFYDGGS